MRCVVRMRAATVAGLASSTRSDLRRQAGRQAAGTQQQQQRHTGDLNACVDIYSHSWVQASD